MKMTHYFYEDTQHNAYANAQKNAGNIVYAVLEQDANNVWVAEGMARQKARKRGKKLAGGYFKADHKRAIDNVTIIKVYKNTKPYYPQPDKRRREPILEWDTLNISDAEIEVRRGDEVYEGQTDDEIRNDIDIDAEFWEREYEYVQGELTQIMDKKGGNGYWKATGTNMGWTQADGYKYFKADTGKELLQAVLPDTETTWRVYRQPRGFEMVVYHHDAPTGEHYFLKPIAERTYDRENF